ncbi:MAG TPA: hypothetical protein DCW29_07005 [Janthinobacterium sp.]|nr:hypothetical protein [Janthinobacterium sp.]
MKKQIINIAPLQAAKVAAVLYLLISLPFVLIMGMSMGAVRATGMPGLSMGVLILLPIVYAVFGGLFTLIGAWIYNLVAGMTGGFEVTTREA